MIKIEISGEYGSGKDALARKIRLLLMNDPFFNPLKDISVQLRTCRGVDGSPVVEGPDDATYLIIVKDA